MLSDRKTNVGNDISIHPPLTGRDVTNQIKGYSAQLFQSTRPSRDGTAWTKKIIGRELFQSTRPSRDGTWLKDKAEEVAEFQSIRPSRDGTQVQNTVCQMRQYFNPPVPRGTGRRCLEMGVG